MLSRPLRGMGGKKWRERAVMSNSSTQIRPAERPYPTLKGISRSGR